MLKGASFIDVEAISINKENNVDMIYDNKSTVEYDKKLRCHGLELYLVRKVHLFRVSSKNFSSTAIINSCSIDFIKTHSEYCSYK